MQRRWFGFVLAAAFMTVPAYGQEVELAWKFAKKDKFFQEMTSDTKQTMTIQGQRIQQDIQQTFLFSWEVLEADEKAEKYTIRQKIEAVKMNLVVGNTPIRYDSTLKDAADSPLSTFFKPLLGAEFTLTLGPKNKVTDIKGREEFIKKLKEANPNMAPLLDHVLTEDQLKQMSEPAFAVVKGPGQKVKLGDTWSRPEEGKLKLTIGPIGSYEARYNFKYGGKDEAKNGLHKIEMKTELDYKVPDSKQAGGLPFKIEGGTLETKDATGTIWFDDKAGRVVQTEMKVNLKGTLKISVAEQKSDVDLDQQQTTTTKTTDRNPYEAAPPK